MPVTRLITRADDVRGHPPRPDRSAVSS